MFKFMTGFLLGSIITFLAGVIVFIETPWRAVTDLKHLVDTLDKK